MKMSALALPDEIFWRNLLSGVPQGAQAKGVRPGFALDQPRGKLLYFRHRAGVDARIDGQGSRSENRQSRVAVCWIWQFTGHSMGCGYFVARFHPEVGAQHRPDECRRNRDMAQFQAWTLAPV